MTQRLILAELLLVAECYRPSLNMSECQFRYGLIPYSGDINIYIYIRIIHYIYIHITHELIDIIAGTFHPFMVRMHKNAPFSDLSDNCVPDGTSSKADAVSTSRRILAGVLNSSSFSSSTGLQIWGKSVMSITHLMFSNGRTG